MTDQDKIITSKLIDAGVSNLREYGYPKVDKTNILTDIIYSKFFKSMLDDNLGQGFDSQITLLIAEIEGNTK